MHNTLYDAYTTGLIVSLAQWLHALGSSVVLMSATLPAEKRRELLTTFGATSVPDVEYPRVTLISGGQTTAMTFPTRPLPEIAVEPAPLEIPPLAALLTSLADRGGCVACIVNTVQRAQDLFRSFENTDVLVYLFHARFPADERQRHEQQVTTLFGKGSANRPERAILIATQVVEQSLDLDFDVMVTDIAPIDLILQRSGRLHRHRRSISERRGHPEPTLYVAGMTRTDTPPNFGEPNYFDKVYDRFILLRTWALLRDLTRIVPPGDIDRFVQRVYGDDEELSTSLLPSTPVAFAEAKAEWKREIETEASAATRVVIGDPRNTWENVDSIERKEEDEGGLGLRALTRKGEESVTVALIYPADTGFALDESGSQSTRLEGKDLTLKEAKAIYMRTVRLSRKGVVFAVKRQSVNRSAWERHPLLRNCYPLILDGTHNMFGKTRVAYSSELGVVYEPITD